VHAPTEDKCDNTKDSFYEELEHVSDQFLKYHINILVGDFNAKMGREDTFKPTIGNESLYETSNDIGARVAKFATSKNLVVMRTMFPHHKTLVLPPDGKTYNQTDHIKIEDDNQAYMMSDLLEGLNVTVTTI
jgi:hypothetical protein